MFPVHCVEDKVTLVPHGLSPQLCSTVFHLISLTCRTSLAAINDMASEKNYTEEVTPATASPLTHQHTASSHGLHHDHIAEEAYGGHTADLGKSYFRSVNFIGTVVVS